ncbi:formate/nitrite transporter family protein [Lacrimispora xylanolytica]|uniref:Formate/nitrite transporter family protein n=1 Tax=Lacrimispora xylanolytica TaxID=29375 RepID=A0ABY7ABM7_9FIRM|nr:formate/nitrite transporter family protein [Lacrimispora xylanolytica]WAJ22926.1 formate/nitrite transporter family protein [Lacrimispora xylanolytica]
MYTNEVNKVAESAQKKSEFLNENLFQYVVLAMMSGFFIIIGIALSFSAAAIIQVEGKMYGKIAIGLTFWVALGLLTFAGGELFTGNCFVFTIGYLKRTVSLKQTAKLLLINYAGNLIGCMVLAFIYVQSKAMIGISDAYIEKTALSKLDIPMSQLFFRAVLCNFVICLAIWLCYKMKEETAKLMMMVFCVLAFAVSGFEHSIANMGIFSIALLLPHDVNLTLFEVCKNVLIVTLGNMAGASLFLGVPYWYASKTKEII